MQAGKYIRLISVAGAGRTSPIMCHHSPCTNSCGSGAMAVDLSLCCPPSSIPIVLPIHTNGMMTKRNDTESGGKCESTDSEDLQRWPTPVEIVKEMKELGSLAGPIAVLGILLYLKAMVSMLFLGKLGDLELAGGSLSIGFANITGYSVLAGLAMGMEPICGQAFGAKRWKLMGLTLQRTILVLFCACLPISILWLNMRKILMLCGQNGDILSVAHTFLVYSLPDLIAQAILNPMRIYLRSQQITTPLTYCAALALALHVPINLLLVDCLGLHVRGVALSTAWTDFNVVLFLLAYLWYSGRYKKTWEGWSLDSFREWRPLLQLAIPSCVSVCLEWWWYEFMIILSGLLVDAQATVASMGILIQTTALVYIFPSSLSLAVSTRVGNELGANRPAKARTAMLVALACAGVVAIMACTFTTSMRHIWGSMFTKDAKILSLVAMVLPIVGLCELGNCPQTTGCGVLRGSARPTSAANINLGSFYLVGMPVAIALGFWLDFGFVGLWFGLLAAQVTCVTLMLSVLFNTDWNKQAQRAKDLTAPHSDAKVVPSLDESDAEENATESFVIRSTEEAEAEKDEDEEREALISVKVVQPHTADDT
ncbi:MATE family, multidrug and toxin extrusion protein [Marchantia polymorpha subsp. ruderalis]|uniref:Protein DETOXIFICATION n=2 Tax=Marchantia polymorpha TaxID=3197 RepID=A0AAF6AXC1_MARPO|nr:hypothetical protein MARPO_0022s0101 [Marchantia polymorpha]BBN04405.1 hypothetical protein Mp_3g04300 [Marchantia polymorpha subsp. ruderalis]|eukprot:PTQ43999.1 hypothetical protein MARPO_0022s0101 [Marchantia polymorpha]